MRIGRIAAAAIVIMVATLTAIIAMDALRGGTVSGSPSPSPNVSLTPTAFVTATVTASASAPAVASPTQSAAARPDAQHGLIIATGGLRTEADPRALQQPSLFATAPSTAYGVSLDGKRIALIEGPQLASQQQIVTFTTARPNDVTTVVDFSGTGEVVTHLVWAGDGSGSVLFEAEKQSRGSGGGDNVIIDYSALRALDIATGTVRELARISGQSNSFWPLAWLPGRQLAAALEVRPLGPVSSYVLVQSGSIQRTALSPNPSPASFNASRDGGRILMFMPSFVRWWSIDEPQTSKELAAQSGETLGHAEFRPGADEIGVDVPSGGRFEIWNLAGQRRVVATRAVGFVHWRVDGTAAIVSPDPNGVFLVDPATGGMTQLPGGGFPVIAVVLF